MVGKFCCETLKDSSRVNCVNNGGATLRGALTAAEGGASKASVSCDWCWGADAHLAALKTRLERVSPHWQSELLECRQNPWKGEYRKSLILRA